MLRFISRANSTFLKKIHLFIFGCIGVCRLSLVAVLRLLSAVASLVVEHGLQARGLQ